VNQARNEMNMLNRVSTVVFAIYIDSYAFVFATSILQHSLGVNSNLLICRGAILLCLACYVTTKVRHPDPMIPQC
jgi:hypothetical protein